MLKSKCLIMTKLKSFDYVDILEALEIKYNTIGFIGLVIVDLFSSLTHPHFVTFKSLHCTFCASCTWLIAISYETYTQPH